MVVFIKLLCFVAAVIIFLRILAVCLELIVTQFVNLFSLYFFWKTEDLSDFHPYTQSILQNRCPEMKTIRNLKRMPQTRDIRNQIKSTIQSMIDMLEANEKEAIRYEIIRQLKAI